MNICVDAISVVAEFLPPNDHYQKSLMLVSKTWYQGVVQQDGMKPKPEIQWPWEALQQRHATKLSLSKRHPFHTFKDTLDESQVGGWLDKLAHGFPNEQLLELELPFDLEKLPQFTQLESFVLGSGGYAQIEAQDDTFAPLAKLKHLRYVSIGHYNCNEAFLRHISGLEHLTTLLIHHGDFPTAQSLQSLSHLKHLTKLMIAGDCEFGDEALAIIASMTTLTSLDIRFGKTVSNDSFKQLITNLGQKVEVLHIMGYFVLTDDPFEHLCGNLPELKELYMFSPQRITSKGWYCLRNLTSVNRIWFGHEAGVEYTDALLEHLAHLSEEDFDLAFQHGVTDNGVAWYISKNAPNLKSLTLLSCGRLTSRSLVSLGIAAQLTRVSIHFEAEQPLPEDSFLQLSKLHSLEEMALENAAMVENSSSFLHLRQNKALEKLTLQRIVNLRDDSFPHIAQFDALKLLMISECSTITDNGFEQLEGMKSLESLTIWSCGGVTGVGLKGPPRLQVLDISETLTNEGLHTISNHLHCLNQFSIGTSESITDEGFHDIQHLHNLEKLDIRHCQKVTTEALVNISRLESLVQFYVSGCPFVSLHKCAQYLNDDCSFLQLRAVTWHSTGAPSRYLEPVRKRVNGKNVSSFVEV